MTEITINGKQYPVIFNMDAMMKFERVLDKSFFACNLNTLQSKIALIVGSILAANENANIKQEDLIGDKTFEEVKEIAEAGNVVIRLVAEYMKIPNIVAESEDEENQPQEGEHVKN